MFFKSVFIALTNSLILSADSLILSVGSLIASADSLMRTTPLLHRYQSRGRDTKVEEYQSGGMTYGKEL